MKHKDKRKRKNFGEIMRKKQRERESNPCLKMSPVEALTVQFKLIYLLTNDKEGSGHRKKFSGKKNNKLNNFDTECHILSFEQNFTYSKLFLNFWFFTRKSSEWHLINRTLQTNRKSGSGPDKGHVHAAMLMRLISFHSSTVCKSVIVLLPLSSFFFENSKI